MTSNWYDKYYKELSKTPNLLKVSNKVIWHYLKNKDYYKGINPTLHIVQSGVISFARDNNINLSNYEINEVAHFSMMVLTIHGFNFSIKTDYSKQSKDYCPFNRKLKPQRFNLKQLVDIISW